MYMQKDNEWKQAIRDQAQESAAWKLKEQELKVQLDNEKRKAQKEKQALIDDLNEMLKITESMKAQISDLQQENEYLKRKTVKLISTVPRLAAGRNTWCNRRNQDRSCEFYFLNESKNTMSMYGYDVSFHDYGFSDTVIAGSIYGNSLSSMAAAVEYDDELYARRRPPPSRPSPPIITPGSPPRYRHDGTSPLPLGMDWSLAPLIWEGRNSVWPHDLHKGWSYCVTIPSLSSEQSAGSSDAVFYSVKVGIQSPEGITTTRTVPRRFNEFLKLYSELKKEFPKKNLPPAPPKRFVKPRSKKVLVDRICDLECWMTKLLSDIDVSRTVHVAIFLDLESAAREACCELNQNDSISISTDIDTSDVSASSPEKETCDEFNSHVNMTSHDDDKSETNGEVVKSKTEIEDLITRLNQETIAKQYFTTKVKDLEMELETKSQSTKDMESDIEELQRKCIELELRLTIEQEARAYSESMMEKNELLKEEMELKSKSTDVLEVKSDNKISEDEVMVSLSDTIDVLETSDTQIGRLLAQVVGEDAENANEDDELRKLLSDILSENAKLRKQVNSVITHALSKLANS
ncbi:hypothetical protein LXL04_009172 [Taraxacum kok-saghyz]